jgi:hypothetical protein
MPKNQPTASQDARRTQKRTGAKYTAALRAEQVRPAVQIRPGDRVTFHHREDDGTVTAVYPDVKNGCPGIDWVADPKWVEEVRRRGAESDLEWEREYTGEHWSFLACVATVNGKPTDYLDRYPCEELPSPVADMPSASLPIPMQAAMSLGYQAGVLDAAADLLPVPSAFHPDDTVPGAPCADGGLVSVLTSLTLHLAVDPEVLADPEALEQELGRQVASIFRYWLEPGNGPTPAG